jgi:hypothetical protein
MSITNDTHFTPVIFRIWTVSRQVTALFPTIPGTGDTLGGECQAYELGGGEQSYEYESLMDRTEAAEPNEYRALAKHVALRTGRQLQVVNWAPDEMHRARRRSAIQARREALASVTTVRRVRR